MPRTSGIESKNYEMEYEILLVKHQTFVSDVNKERDENKKLLREKDRIIQEYEKRIYEKSQQEVLENSDTL